MRRSQRQLGDILVKKGVVTTEQLDSALMEQKRTKAFLGEILIKRSYIREKDLLGALSEQFDMPVVSIKNEYIDWNFVKRFSPSLIIDHECLPFENKGMYITVAITNPLDAWAVKKAEDESGGSRLKLVLVSKKEMAEAIERYKQYVQRQ